MKEQKTSRTAKTPLIAIVDDDNDMRRSLDNLIRSFGFRTQGFASGEEFLSSPHRHDAECLLLDVRMTRMNGLEVQRRIAASQLPIPIIVMTSYADEAVQAKALAAGAVDFLYKPFPEEKLLKAIDKALQRS
jgi:FixJ family two-component response regulator